MIDSGTLLQERYLIEDKIGMGGMGAVYRAIDQKFGSLVAIKRTFYGDDELAKAFEREARLLNGLHHPILPHVSDYFSENGDHFLVMEYIEGDDLSELLKRGERFPVSTVLGWTLDLLDGLDYLHSQDPPVIHRDIKPHNMKLTSRGKIMLLDFGMAKETSANTLATKSVFGYSRRYSPFEQIEGTGTDVRSDIFSLGASVYHLLAGEPPVDVLRRVSAIVAGKPDPIIPAAEVNSNVSSSVSELLTTALAINAEDRFDSARTMWNALEYSINAGAVQQEDEALSAGTAAAIMPPHPHTDEYDTKPVTASSPVAIGSQDDPLGNGLGSQNLKRKLRRAIPASISNVRIARPSINSRSAKWLPLVAACLAIALLAIYFGFRNGENGIAQNEPSAAASTQNVMLTSDSSRATEPRVPETSKRVENETPAVPAQKTAREKTRDREVPADRTDAEEDTREESRPAAAPDRRSNTKRASDQRRPRVVEPAFEQPSVSSIDAIMTGVPNDRGGRWADERDQWTEDELRRRQIRRIIRENRRRQQPF